MKETLKKFGSKVGAGVTALGVAFGSAMTALADGSLADTMNNTISDGATSAVSGITSMLSGIAPKIIGIVVGVIVLTVGIAWLKKVKNQSK